MASLIRLGILFGCLCYFSLCIAAGLEVSYILHQVMIALFLLFAFIVIVRYLVLLGAAISEKNKIKTETNPSWTPSISIIMPAFNEEELIKESLNSLVEIDYPNYEIIIIDDGSTDGTAHVAHQLAERNSATRISIISQSNSGKSWALNTGIVHAQGEFVVCVDSDSRLNPDALKVGVQHFKDHRVGAVGGFINAFNCNKLITRMQQLEYVIGQNFLRRGLSLFNIVTIVPGPIGMFRKEAIQQVGFYNTLDDCFAEDADLTVRLLANGWRVKGETQMIAHTEAPDTLYTLLRQRYRWRRGIFQAFFGNVYRLITSSNKNGVFIAAILTFESFVFDIVSFGITLFAITSFLALAEFKVFLWAIAVLGILDLIVLVFTHLGRGHLYSSFWLFLLQKISYAYVLQAWGVFALFDELLSTKMRWDKLERIGASPLRIG